MKSTKNNVVLRDTFFWQCLSNRKMSYFLLTIFLCRRLCQTDIGTLLWVFQDGFCNYKWVRVRFYVVIIFFHPKRILSKIQGLSLWRYACEYFSPSFQSSSCNVSSFTWRLARCPLWRSWKDVHILLPEVYSQVVTYLF